MNWSGLPSVSFAELSFLPACSGIYIACSGDQILYIGQSQNIKERWINKHHRFEDLSSFNEVRIYWLNAPVGILDTLERAMVWQLRPSLNARLEAPSLFAQAFPQDLSVEEQIELQKRVSRVSGLKRQDSYRTFLEQNPGELNSGGGY